jgi:hypothetical protein
MSLLEKRISLKWVIIVVLAVIAVFAVVKQRQEVGLINRTIRQLDVNGQSLAQFLNFNLQQGRLVPMPQQQAQQPVAKEEPKPTPKEVEKKK